MSIFRSIISPMHNCDEIAVRFCSQLKVKVTETSAKKEITEHPDYPSLLSISDALRTYKVDNVSLKTKVENFNSFPTPFIVQVKGQVSNYSLFGIISEVLPDSRFRWYNPENKKDEVINSSEFEKLFSGYVMLAEADMKSGETDFKMKRQEEKRRNFINGAIALFIPLILIALSVYTIVSKGFLETFSPIVYSIVTLIGAITGALLLLYEVDQHNPTLQKVCHSGKRTNCGAILNSKASQIWGISWSSIGFTYFMGTLLTMIVGGLTNSIILSVVAYINLFALPYIIFSIYYQAKVAHQWCPMCLIVQACLALQFIISITGHFYQFPSVSFLLPVFTLVTCCVVVFASVYILTSALRKSKEGKYLHNELARLKHNPEIFNALLEKQKKISTSTNGLGITLGNPVGKIKLIKVCNPYCGPCAMAHPIIDELLENNPNLQVQIIFTASGEVNDLRTPPVQHLLAIANQGDKLLLESAIDDWYLSEKRDYDRFAQKYPMNGELKTQMSKINAMHKWTEREEIAFTPTFFINGYQLPENYHVSDLRYFLSV